VIGIYTITVKQKKYQLKHGKKINMTLKQALQGDDMDIITMYAQIAYNEFDETYIKEIFENSDYYTFIINDIVYVFYSTKSWIKDPTISVLNCIDKN